MRSFASVLRDRADSTPDRHAFRFLGSRRGEVDNVTYEALLGRAAALARRLDVSPGDRVLLLHPPGIGYIAAFFGCLLVGAIPVPAYPPRNNRNLERLRAILDDAGAHVAIATDTLVARVGDAPELAGLRWVTTDLADIAEPPPLSHRELAFLQYTSGSTGSPKGVMVTHANLYANTAAIAERFGLHRESQGVIWLPPFHDMGLIGGILAPLATGFPCTLMAPTTFLVSPIRWLEAVSDERGTVAGGPDFAWALCARRINEEARAKLDLSSWTAAFTGAEPVRTATLDRFAEAFAVSKFPPRAWLPCYGLAEATLIVSGTPSMSGVVTRNVSAEGLARFVAEPGDQTIVSCGPAALDSAITIVDEQGNVQPDEHIGEIVVRGPGIASGYWGMPDVSLATFGTPDDHFLKTGDLGFLSGGQLYITGRKKDLIVLRGRNLYPQDVEIVAEAAHPDLRAGGSAAFGVELDGEERLVIAMEVEARRSPDAAEVSEAVKLAVVDAMDAAIHEVLLLPAGTLPRTSSGKVRRSTTRASWLAGTLKDEEGE